MLLTFKRMFAPYVRGGSKRHTIRAPRVRQGERVLYKVGEPCNCYVDPRMKTMALLGRWACLGSEPIRIWMVDTRLHMAVSEKELDRQEADLMAWKDGFRWPEDPENPARCETLMGSFWISVHGVDGEPFDGDLIHWAFDAPMPLPGDTQRLLKYTPELYPVR